MALKNIWAWVAIAAGLVGLALDFQAIAGTMVVGAQNPVARSLPNMLIYYWTFLTNLSNLGLILVYLSALTSWGWLGWFRHPVTRAGMAGLITLVMVYFHIALAPELVDMPPGIVISNMLLHTITPLLFLGWWLFFNPHGSLRFRDVPAMLVPGVTYVVYVLVRGLIAGEYPYTILDPTFAIPGHGAQGYLGVGIGVLVLVVFVAIFDAILIFIDGLIARRRATA